MAAGFKERCSREVINRDEAIKALKKENETLEAEKARLSEDLKMLPWIRREVEVLKKEKEGLELEASGLKKEKEELEVEVVSLQRSASKAWTARYLAVQWAEKADGIAARLQEELEAECTSIAAMQTRIKEAEVEATSVIGLYSNALAQFGSSTSAPLGCGDVGVCLAWVRSHVSKLPDFVGGAVDFGTVAADSTFGRLLRRGGCLHVEAVQKESFSSVAEVGEATFGLRKSVQNFISSFEARFGRAEARNMAEACHAEVRHGCLASLRVVGFCWVFHEFVCFYRSL